MITDSFRLTTLLTILLAIFLAAQPSVALTEDDFDFTDAVRNPPTEEVPEPVAEEPVQESTTEGELAGFVVCIDPGHSSEVTDGLTVLNGATERHINWILSLEIADLLKSYGCTVIVTKSTEEQLLTNMERAEIANENNADVMVRIHCDTGVPEAHGLTFYYPDRQGEWFGNTGPALDLIPKCRDAATAIHSVAMEKLDGLLYDRGVKTDMDTYIGGQQGGALRASILSEVPILLVEVCFLSNPDDAAIIKNATKRTLIANALADGIREYLLNK
ncbi:MAG: N-acetylmuramoyl-L-alanine amidase [bacterium]|nr:N-acetylmuramoyl-L-alanine amidase [bacterium]